VTQPSRTGIAHLPLHGGKAPRWLFDRMTRLAREISIAIVSDFGPNEMLHRLSDPFWFQAFGCVMRWDWHSSGAAPSYRDPARYSFAHGGKDGIPYPVDRMTYDKTVEVLSKAVKKAKLGQREEMEALRKLNAIKP